MIPAVTSLHLSSLGLPDSAVKCSVRLNKDMKHYVQTATGTTNEFYRHSAESPKYGEGQGKTSSPSNWLFQSSTILLALHALVTGVLLTSICNRFKSQRVAESYVDDTDCMYCDQSAQNKDTDVISAKIQHTAQTWETLVFGTGGALSLKKTCWWLLHWTWDGGKATMSTVAQAPARIAITLGRSAIPTTVTRKEPNQSVKQLGVLVNPAGSFAVELERRVKYSTSLATRLRRVNMTPMNALRLYRNIWLPSCQYPLAVTSFTKDECAKTEKPFL
jgi:hypothetical protein